MPAPDTLEAPFALQERWEANEARKRLIPQCAAAKAEIPVIVKTGGSGTHTRAAATARITGMKTSVRSLAPSIRFLRGTVLSYRWRTTSEINQPVSVTCIVSHRSSYSETNTYLPVATTAAEE